nr:unnamed protein product [Spirometra erinaceieuropaei]
MVGTGVAEADAETTEGGEEEGDSGGSGDRSMLVVGVDDEAELDEETAAGVVRVLQFVQICPTKPIAAGTSAASVGRSRLVERWRCDLQFPSKTAETKMIESPRLLLVHCPGLRCIQQLRQDDRFVHPQSDVEVEPVVIPNGAFQTAKGLPSFGDSSDRFIADLGGEGEDADEVDQTVHDLQLDVVHVTFGCDLGGVVWRLLHNHCCLHVNDQTEVVTGGGDGDGSGE